MSHEEDLERVIAAVIERLPEDVDPEPIVAALRVMASVHTGHFTDAWFETAGGAAIPDPTGAAMALIGVRCSMDLRRVSLDELEIPDVGSVEVSTVFLVINHSFGDGRPMLYETMLFSEDPEVELSYQWRYATRESAEIGHRTIVDALRAGATLESLDQLTIQP